MSFIALTDGGWVDGREENTLKNLPDLFGPGVVSVGIDDLGRTVRAAQNAYCIAEDVELFSELLTGESDTMIVAKVVLDGFLAFFAENHYELGEDYGYIVVAGKFEEYAEDQFERMHNVDLAAWPYNHIDWHGAAEQLKDDYAKYVICKRDGGYVYEFYHHK